MTAHPAFESWYAPGGPGSGIGSSPEYTAEYRKWFQEFLERELIHSVFDFGCGDWQFSRLIDWSPVIYHGVDVVPSLIERLQAEHGNLDRKFSIIDHERPEESFPKERWDLFLSKDVFQHLPTSYALRLLPLMRRFRTCLLVNDWSDYEWTNAEIRVGEYRPLDFAKPPFNLDVTLAFDFGTEWRKRAYLWRPNP